eukprot:scaffold1019_cov97-Skeletonema_marinoi.AAC.9
MTDCSTWRTDFHAIGPPPTAHRATHHNKFTHRSEFSTSSLEAWIYAAVVCNVLLRQTVMHVISSFHALLSNIEKTT